jgi:acyl-coenzyme A thioesterase PaaI-like protein
MNKPAKRQIRSATLSQNWNRFKDLPAGKRLFSFVVGRTARYTGTIGAVVQVLEEGRCEVTMRDRPIVRNHLRSVHAIALMNLGEMVTGLAVMFQVDGKGRGIVKGLEMEYLKKARGTITGICEYQAPAEPGTYDKLIVEGFLRDDTGDNVAIIKATWKLDIYET